MAIHDRNDNLYIIHTREQASEGQCFTAQPCTVVCAYMVRLLTCRQQHSNQQVSNLRQRFAIMKFNGLLFCTACGNLLPRVSKTTVSQIACDICETLTTSMKNDIIIKMTPTNLPRRVARPNKHGFSSNRLSIRTPTQTRPLRHTSNLSRHRERPADYQRRMSPVSQPRNAVPRGSDAWCGRGIHDFLHVPKVFLQIQHQQLIGLCLSR